MTRVDSDLKALAMDRSAVERFIQARCAGKRVTYLANLGNMGDALIAHGAFQLLNRIGVPFDICRTTDEVDAELLIVAGGGNLVEGLYSDIASFIAGQRRETEIIVLPHTVVGFTGPLLDRRDRLHIFAREHRTYGALLRQGLPNDRVFLADDLAFGLDIPRFPPPTRSRLTALRTDVEASGQFQLSDRNLDLSAMIVRHWDDPHIAEKASEMFLGILADYEHVLTDRLHVAIGAALVGRRVTFLSNSYFKNSAVYETSMSRAPNVTFIDVESAPAAALKTALEPFGVVRWAKAASGADQSGLDRAKASDETLNDLPVLLLHGLPESTTDILLKALGKYPGVHVASDKTPFWKSGPRIGAPLYVTTNPDDLFEPIPGEFSGSRSAIPLLPRFALTQPEVLAGAIARRKRIRIYTDTAQLAADDPFAKMGELLSAEQFMSAANQDVEAYPEHILDGLRGFSWLPARPAWLSAVVKSIKDGARAAEQRPAKT